MTVYMLVNGSILQTASVYNTNEHCLHGKLTYVGEIDYKLVTTSNHSQQVIKISRLSLSLNVAVIFHACEERDWLKATLSIYTAYLNN